MRVVPALCGKEHRYGAMYLEVNGCALFDGVFEANRSEMDDVARREKAIAARFHVFYFGIRENDLP
jgi:hypothetical protein